LYDYLKNNQQTIVVNENDPIQVEKTKTITSTITFGKESSDYNYESFSEEHFVGMSYSGVKLCQNLPGNIILPIFVLQQVLVFILGSALKKYNTQ
jgi:UDP-N-acetylmuramoyl-tripeptide--D-alanyl-D-alanine ligase